MPVVDIPKSHDLGITGAAEVGEVAAAEVLCGVQGWERVTRNGMPRNTHQSHFYGIYPTCNIVILDVFTIFNLYIGASRLGSANIVNRDLAELDARPW